MALQAQQIVALATQIAGVPGYTSQAGQLLNMILSDLCQTYDFDLARGVTTVTLGTSVGSGPYSLPADYLRAEYDDVFFTLYGVKYPLTNIDLSEFDLLVQQAGMYSYPSMYATDLSSQNATPVMYVWPPSSGAYPLTIRDRRQMPDITTPESSTTVPWFPNQDYLVTRLAGELMKIADDERAGSFLGAGDIGAQGILDRYLKLKDDSSVRADVVRLDRRRFGSSWNKVPNTKQVGW